MFASQSFLAAALALVITANVVCFGSLQSVINLALAPVPELDAGVAEASRELNVFGWASVAPCYGGTGSGALNDNYHIVDLLEGLENAGFNTNTEF